MKDLLTKVKAALSGVLTGLRDSDIIILASSDLLPGSVRLPCIGIKDGRTTYHELPSDTLETELPVEVYLFDQYETGEDCVLDYMDKGDQVFERLRDNLLSGYVRDVSPESATPIFLLYTDSRGPLLRKGFFFKYETQEE